ncbi:MAG: efflux RND transporter periplasmic adaptor subunit [Amaricoccus sp.]
MWRLALILLVALGAAAGAYVYLSRPTSVSVAVAARGEAAEIVYATGVVEPSTWAKVAPLVRERIVELCNCEGGAVTRGDVLARLDDSEPQAVLRELVAREDFAMRDLTRLRDLAARNVGTQQELERAESEEARIQALIAAQDSRLQSYVLRAPLDGIVLRQEGDVGEIADPAQVLFWVGQPHPLRIVAEVNEEDIPRVAPGQRTLLRADAFPDAPLEARVASITPMGDPVAKTYRVYFALPQDTPLMIGMTVEVNVVTTTRPKALLVPVGALTADGAVFVVKDGRARRREVATGIRGTTEVEVTDGLTEGETVVVPAPDGLADGARVVVAATR